MIVETYLKDPNPFGRCRRAQRSFYLRFNKAPPTERTITSLVHKFHNKHNLLDLNKANSGRPRTARTVSFSTSKITRNQTSRKRNIFCLVAFTLPTSKTETDKPQCNRNNPSLAVEVLSAYLDAYLDA